MRHLLKKYQENISAAAALAAINVIIYREYWTSYKIFSGKDFLTGFHLLLNFQSDCMREGSWPLWNPFMNFGYPYVEHYINSAFFPTHLLLGFLTGSSITIIQMEILFWIIIGGFGIYLCTREFGLSFTTGLIAGTSFMACGQIVALPQWHTLVYNAACFPYLISGYHRAKRLGTHFDILSVAFMTFSILGGYTVASVLGMYFFAAYVAADGLSSRKSVFAMRYLVITFATAMLFSLPKLLPLYKGMSSGPRMAVAPASQGPKDTFNIITPYNFLSFLLPVKFYFSLFIGSLNVLAFINGIARRSLRFTPLLIMTLVSGWLLISDSNGNASLLRELASFLPFMKLVRNDWLSWYYPSIFAILLCSSQVEDFLFNTPLRFRLLSLAAFVMIVSAVFFTAYNQELYTGAFLFHIAAAAAWCFLGIASIPVNIKRILAIAFIAAEFLVVFSRVSIDTPPVHSGERTIYTVVDQGSVSRSFMDDNNIRSFFYAEATSETARPGIDEARSWPFLISGLNGAPTYNFYPEQYGKFMDSMNLKKFAGWWYNTQERFDFISLKDSQLLSSLEGQPLFLLINTSSGTPIENAVTFDRLSCSSFSFTTASGGPSFLMLRQMFDPRWSVRIDNTTTTPVRADFFFMGVPIQAGTHKVDFFFHDNLFLISSAISMSALTGSLVFTIVRRINRRRSAGRENRAWSPAS